jgi:putative membrane protein
MIRTLLLSAALAASLALPVLAETTTAKTPAGATEATAPAARGALFTEKQARAHLAHLGYVNVSDLTKDENGVWHGSALKDGKRLAVAVDIKGHATN